MKIFIVAATIFTCISSYASALTQNEIVEAIKEALARSPLTCVATGEVNRTVSSNELNWSVLGDEVEVKINENKQPVIVFRGKKDYESEISVTTSDDYLQVTKIKGMIYKLGSIQRRNIGTIVNPVFENVYTPGKLYQKVICE